jgi:hypothetical protein
MCCAAIPASGDPYNVNLANKDIYWGSVLSDDRLPFVEGKGIVSSGPYLIDVNHRESALLIGPLVVWVNGLMPKADQKQTPLDKVDLRGTKVRIAVRLEHAPWRNEFDPRIGGKLVFWFQSSLRRGAIPGGDYEMPWRTANYAYNREISLTSGEPVEIDVKPDLNQWTCLGRNPIDTRPLIGSAAKYTCALNQEEFAQAMSKPENMGVLFLLPSKTPDGTNLAWLNAFAPYRTPIMGNTSFILREFVIQRDDSRPAAGDF